MSEKSALWYRCKEFITEQSAGEWGDKAIIEDTEKLLSFVMTERLDLLAALQYVMNDDHGIVPRASSECRKVVAAAIAKATGAA